MKNICRVGIVFFLLLSSAFGVQAVNVENYIESVQQSIPSGTPQAPSGFEQKGFVGEILSGIFNSAGNITNEYIEALKDILSLNQNNVPKWDGSVFQEGTIWDRGGNIGIGNPNPTRRLDVAGDINFTGDLYQDGGLFVSGGGNLWSEVGNNIYRGTGRVGIGTSSPSQQLHTTGTARFDGGVQVDGITSIRSDNASHNAQPSSGSTYNGYGLFDGRNRAGERGYYLGGGNGGDRVNFILDEADKFYIGKTLNARATLVGIGVLDPEATLHVNGNIISDNPTQGNHVTTKSYVDNSISTATSGLPGKFIDGTNPSNAVYTRGRVGVGTLTPEQQLHTTGTVRFDGGVKVGSRPAISSTNATHSAYYFNDTYYGAFQGYNGSGDRGFYLGFGDGSDRVNLHLEKATQLNISGGDVGIGINNPSAKLHVNGNVIGNDPVQGNHLTTKNYVDAQISSISPGNVLPTCSNGQILKHNGTEFVCAADGTGRGSSTNPNRPVELTLNSCEWVGTGKNIYSDNQVHQAECPSSRPLMSGWQCRASKYLDGDCAIKCCTLSNTRADIGTSNGGISYDWVTGNWEPCAGFGESGYENPRRGRSVTCQSSNGSQVSTSYCTKPRPSSSQSCTINNGTGTPFRQLGGDSGGDSGAR